MTKTKRLTHAELAAAHTRNDWTLLWGQATPLVRLAVRRTKHVDTDEMFQQGMLIAGEAIRTWRPLECAFSTHIIRRVQGDLANYAIECDRGGIGSYKQKPVVLSLGEDRSDTDCDDEESAEATLSAALTYAGVALPSGQYDGIGYVPEGFGDPSEEADVRSQAAIRAALQHLTEEEANIVFAVYGLSGRREQPLAEYAEAHHIPYRTAKRRLAGAKSILAHRLANFRD